MGINPTGGMYNEVQAQHIRPEHKTPPTHHVVVAPASLPDFREMMIDWSGHLTVPSGYWENILSISVTRGVWVDGVLIGIFGGYRDEAPGVVSVYFIPSMCIYTLTEQKFLLKAFKNEIIQVLMNTFRPHRIQTLVNYKNKTHMNFTDHLGFSLEGILKHYPVKDEYAAIMARYF